MAKQWKLKRTKQCQKCPWKKSTNPYDIPNGYSVEKHKALKSTIAESGNICLAFQSQQHVMACHETHDAHCIGWLAQQAGSGNNIGLRLHLMSCSNVREIELVGEQHTTFEDTLPE